MIPSRSFSFRSFFSVVAIAARDGFGQKEKVGKVSADGLLTIRAR